MLLRLVTCNHIFANIVKRTHRSTHNTLTRPWHDSRALLLSPSHRVAVPRDCGLIAPSSVQPPWRSPPTKQHPTITLLEININDHPTGLQDSIKMIDWSKYTIPEIKAEARRSPLSAIPLTLSAAQVSLSQNLRQESRSRRPSHKGHRSGIVHTIQQAPTRDTSEDMGSRFASTQGG